MVICLRLLTGRMRKNEASKQRMTAVLPMTGLPLALNRLTASYTHGRRVADSVHAGGSWTFIIKLHHDDGYLVLINVLHPFGWNFWSLSAILVESNFSTIAAIQAPFDYIEPKQGGDYDRLQARNDFNVNMESKEKFKLYCIRRLIIWCEPDGFTGNSKLQAELLVSLSNQVASCIPEMNQKNWRRWRRCRQI